MTDNSQESFGAPDDRAFFGHPRGLAFLAFTEAWERFSFYGMSGLLLLYMVQRLLTPEVMHGVFGLAHFRSALEMLTGPLSNQAFASQVYGLYSGFVYFTPVFGGLLADRWLGQRRTVMLGAVVMSAGHILMAFDGGFLLALLLLVLGTGCLKGNISAQVGHLYPPDDETRRTRAFAIFSAAINFGALAGPLTCGILAQAYGWHVGFATAGVLMLLALVTYVSGRKYLPADRKRTRGGPKPAKLTGRDWRVIAALLFLSVLGVLPAVAYYQETNSGLLFIDASVDRRLFRWTIPTTTFNALDGLFCILAVPPLIALWRWQAKRGREPGDMGKIAIGYLLTALANVMMMIPAGRADHGATVGVFWPIALFALTAVGFLFYWPTLLALFSRAAPAPVNSTMMGLLFFSIFAGNILVGTLGGLWEKMSHARFFALHAAIAFFPFVVMVLAARPLTRLLGPPPPPPEQT
ncbi:MAG TPA: peptide MFS transporter [Labilithrix sp.]|nr:peptide MFS transporter [Labilithrix sp.]